MNHVIRVLIILALTVLPGLAYDATVFPGKGSRADFSRALKVAADGDKLSNSGKNKEAIELYQKAIAIYPYNAATHFNLGCCFDQLGDNAKAVAAYRKAIALDPTYSKAYTNLTGALAGLNDLKGAEAAARTACRLEPSDASAHMNLGEVLLLTKKPKEALKYIDAALKMPNSGRLKEELGRMRTRALKG